MSLQCIQKDHLLVDASTQQYGNLKAKVIRKLYRLNFGTPTFLFSGRGKMVKRNIDWLLTRNSLKSAELWRIVWVPSCSRMRHLGVLLLSILSSVAPRNSFKAAEHNILDRNAPRSKFMRFNHKIDYIFLHFFVPRPWSTFGPCWLPSGTADGQGADQRDRRGDDEAGQVHRGDGQLRGAGAEGSPDRGGQDSQPEERSLQANVSILMLPDMPLWLLSDNNGIFILSGFVIEY